MSHARRNALVATTFVGLLLGTASCGDDAADSTSTRPATDKTPASTVASDQSTADPTDPSGDTGSEEGCNVPRKAVEAALEGNADVVEISNDGSCGVDVTTSLTKESGGLPKAVAICVTASAAAYANGGNSVQVYSPDQEELSISVKGTDCIGEP